MSEETTPTPTETPASEAPSTPDLSEQIAAMSARFDTFEERLPAPPEQPSAEVSPDELFAALTEEDGADEYDDTPEGYAQEEPANDGELTQGEIAELERYISERVAEQINPVVQQFETAQRQSALAGLAERYGSEFRNRETLGAIHARLSPLVERYGDGVLTDPGLVEQAYLAERAARAAANETPAAEARGQGAHLETGTGAAGDPGVPPEEQIVKEILGSGGQRSAFTSGY